MTDVRDDAAAPEQQAAPTWTSYTDKAVIEMRPWDGIESLGGIAASEAARSLDDRWRMLYGPARQGDYIARNPGDDMLINWWVIPASVVAQRYAAS